MKTFNLLTISLAFGAAALLTSCQKEPQTSAVTDDGVKSIALSINFGGAATKATLVSDDFESGWEANTHNFTSFDIFFTDATGVIKYAFRAKADGNVNEQTIYNNLMETNGVKFIGLEEVSQIYVVANGPALDGAFTFTETGVCEDAKNISLLNEQLKLAAYDGKAQAAMPYIGSDISFEDITDASSINNGAGEVVIGDNAGQYVKADITIRPAISRLEINKVGLVTSGDLYYKLNAEGALVECGKGEAIYKVNWNGFDADLVGIYMSNFVTKNAYFPASNVPSIDAWTVFETPSFETAEGSTSAPIEQGQWKVDETILSAELKPLATYSNYEGNSYAELVTADYSGTTGSYDGGTNNVSYLFDGSKPETDVVVPFNFFVPFDLNTDADAAGVVSLMEETPRLHFQFKQGTTITTTVSKNNGTQGNEDWVEVDNDNDPIKVQLDAEFNWPTVAGGPATEVGIAFANVGGFVDEQQKPVKLQPGYIYRVQDVVVNPTTITASTTSSDLQNIYVVVDVVEYTTKNVYPVFD